MIKYNLDNIKIQFRDNEYIYCFNYIDNNIIIKRIIEYNNKKEIDYIIINSKLIYKKVIYRENYKSIVHLSKIDKNNIIMEIFDKLKFNSYINDLFDINSIEKSFFNTKYNILISNGIIGLSNESILNLKSNSYIVDIVLIDSNICIGNILVEDSIIRFNIDNLYEKDTLYLFSKLLCMLNKGDKTLCKKLNNY